SSRRRHTRFKCNWSSDVCSSDLTTLNLDHTLRRVAELVRKVIDYEIFAILLLNERTQELRIRFQVGYPPNVAERARVRVGQGVRSEERRVGKEGRDGAGSERIE